MRRCFILSLLALALPLQAWSQTSAVTPTSIAIHHIGPFVGQLAESNAEALRGAELYFDQVNAAGGIHGRKVTLQKLDDKQDGKEAGRLFKELIDQQKALAVFMPRTTPSTQALMTLSEESGVPLVASQSGAAFITEPLKRSVFSLRASYQDEVISLIQLMNSTGITRFGFLAATDSYGKDVMEGAQRALKELKLEAVSVQPVDQKTPEVADAVTKMLAANPQVVVLIAGVKGATDFVKLYRSKGGTAQFAALSNNGSDSFVKALGEYKRGVIVTQIVPTPFRRNKRFVRDYVNLMDAHKITPSFVSLYGYLSARVLVEGLRRAGRDLTPEKLTNALQGLGTYDLGDYLIEFGPQRRQGTKFVQASIIGYDGKFTN
ncbi:MAG: ABC transporter substrate-binding protein [Ramlibacter sp.]|nr:ABC transporter substrate-binding protein [Ramlibacter sp.]